MSQLKTNWSFWKPLAGLLGSAWACLLSGVLQTRPQILSSPFLSLPEVVPLAEQPVSSEAGSHHASPWPLCSLFILFLLPGIPSMPHHRTFAQPPASSTPSFYLSASTNVNSRSSWLPITVYPLSPCSESPCSLLSSHGSLYFSQMNIPSRL